MPGEMEGGPAEESPEADPGPETSGTQEPEDEPWGPPGTG